MRIHWEDGVIYYDEDKWIYSHWDSEYEGEFGYEMRSYYDVDEFTNEHANFHCFSSRPLRSQ